MISNHVLHQSFILLFITMQLSVFSIYEEKQRNVRLILFNDLHKIESLFSNHVQKRIQIKNKLE